MKRGIDFAISAFKQAASSNVAYKKLLKKNRISPRSVTSAKQFANLPILDKTSLIGGYSTADLYGGKTFPPALYASSGSSGKPTFWFRTFEQEQMGAGLHEQIFRNVFNIRKSEPTLVIVCFSMGIWVAGHYTAEACRLVAKAGYNITVATPGIEIEDILSLLMNIAPLYKNVVIAGYPPFIIDVLLQAKDRGITLPKRMFYITAGDKVDEPWREAVTKAVGQKDLYNTNSNIYGCADATMLAYETPLSIFIRRAALKNKKLYTDLFADASILPALFQYDDSSVYFETSGEELVFTISAAAPLIRYNIHDIGSLYSFSDMGALLKRHSLYTEAKKYGLTKFAMPFIVKRGRTDVAVTTYALNIYPEHIEQGLSQQDVHKHVSGNYFAFTRTAKNAQEELHFNIELARGEKITKKLVGTIRAALVGKLLEVNVEYRKLHATIGERALPVVNLFTLGDVSLVHASQGLRGTKGKKPKMIV